MEIREFVEFSGVTLHTTKVKILEGVDYKRLTEDAKQAKSREEREEVIEPFVRMMHAL